MNTISIMSEHNISLAQIRRMLASRWENGWSVDGMADRIVVQESRNRVYIYQPAGQSGTVDTKGLALDYWSVPLVKAIIEIIADSPDMMVANEFGTVLPGDQFAARIRRDSDWRWEVDPNDGESDPKEQ